MYACMHGRNRKTRCGVRLSGDWSKRQRWDAPPDDDDDDGGDDDEWSAVMRIEVEARTRARTRIVSESDRGVGPNG